MVKQLRSATEPADIVVLLFKHGVSPEDIAAVGHVDLAAVDDWKTRCAVPDDVAYGRLDALRGVVSEIADTLTPDGVAQWLQARNRGLEGRRPIEALAEGDTLAILRVARAFADGTYA